MWGSTISQRLKSAIGIVTALSVLLLASGYWGLSAFSIFVEDLDYAIHNAPHQSKLVEIVSDLFRPLQARPDQRWDKQRMDKFFLTQATEFQKTLRNTIQQFFDFRRRLAAFETRELVSGRKQVTDQILLAMQARLSELQNAWPAVESREQYLALVNHRRAIVSQLVLDAYRVPDPVEGMTHELDQARRLYRFLWGFAIAVAIGGLVIYLVILVSAQRSLLRPLKTLREAAVHIGKGNYHTRVTIPGPEEMSDLAEALNKMASRFLETKTGLDEDVRIRSQQLVRSERLANVGILAAGVAHEINNPLSAIRMAADALLARADEVQHAMKPEDYDVVVRYLKMIDDESERCRNITARLLDFARGGNDTAYSLIDLTQPIRDVIQIVQLNSKFRDKEILFERQFPCYIECRAPEIKQVILNLVANGLESMEPGGTLEIELIEKTDQVVLRVRDSGCGMTPEVKQHLFEPFFTQKQAGQGTGLGLSISHRIIEDHGGTINAESDGPGTGSTFVIHLPKQAVVQNSAAA